MLGVLTGVVAPVLSVALLGALLRTRGVLDPAPISRLTLYALTPSLVFSSISGSRLSPGQSARLVLAFVLLLAALYAFGRLAVRLTSPPDSTRASYLLSTLFMNSGNFGLPVVTYAYGERAYAVAALYFVAQSVSTNTLGAYVASRGSATPREALGNVLRVPALYAAALALPFALTRTPPPALLARPAELLGRAAIPMLLLVLGAQLRLRLPLGARTLSVAAICTRLALSPLIAAALALACGLERETAAVFVLQSGMPTAVLTVVLATEFEADTEFLTGVVAYSTLASVPTLSALILLGR